MNKILITVSGDVTEQVNMVCGELASQLKQDSREKEREGYVVEVLATNAVGDIQRKENGLLVFNIEIFDNTNAHGANLLAAWRLCSTVFPRLIINFEKDGSLDSLKGKVAGCLSNIFNWCSKF